jgi:hypothetical protein
LACLLNFFLAIFGGAHNYLCVLNWACVVVHLLGMCRRSSSSSSRAPRTNMMRKILHN